MGAPHADRLMAGRVERTLVEEGLTGFQAGRPRPYRVTVRTDWLRKLLRKAYYSKGGRASALGGAVEVAFRAPKSEQSKED
jgi:hypothetical protein